MSLTQLIYTSRPFGYDDPTLVGILSSARHFNKRDGITGSLICREDVFLQLLEGPADKVAAAYARIARDDRHVDVVKLCETAAQARIFPGWDMRHDPARSWMWNAKEVEGGALACATAQELLAVFARVAAEPDGQA